MEAQQSVYNSLQSVRASGGNGGARLGAGRPEGAKDSYARVRLPKGLRRTLRAQFRAEVENSSKGAARVMRAYWRLVDNGEAKVILDTFNRIMGRPVTTVELSGPGGAPIRLQAAAALALSMAAPEQLAAIEAFSRLMLPSGADDGAEDDSADDDSADDDDSEPDDIAGELAEAPEDVPRDIIVRPDEPESPQVSEPVGVSAISDDVADWLSEK